MELPLPNLDDKVFDEILKEALSGIPTYAPEWTDHNVHDPGITFIELFTWLSEMQIYRLNRITDRIQRKFLKLLGIPRLTPAKAAEVELTFSLLSGNKPPVHVPAGTKVAAVDPISGKDIVFETKHDLYVKEKQINTVLAVQGITYEECKFSSHGLACFYIDLKDTPIKEKTLVVKVKEKHVWIKWNDVEDFDASKPGDRHYTADSATGRVTFGDGINGKIPPKGEDNVMVSYCAGGGLQGNVEPHAIYKVLDVELSEKVAVDNVKAASGGEEAETPKEAICRIRKDMKTVYRAVTSDDYEFLALNTPGVNVARAKAVPRYHLNQLSDVPGIVTVIVVPQFKNLNEQPQPDINFLKSVFRYLDKHRLMTTELFVIPPEYFKITVDAKIVIKPEFLPNTIEENVKEELRTFLNPVTGGPDRQGWPFGRSVYISEIYEIIDRVEGVDYVKTNTLTLKKNDEEQEGDIRIPAYGLVFSGVHVINALEKEDIYG